MKKLMTIMLSLAFLTGAIALADDAKDAKTTKTKTNKKNKTGKKDTKTPPKS